MSEEGAEHMLSLTHAETKTLNLTGCIQTGGQMQLQGDTDTDEKRVSTEITAIKKTFTLILTCAIKADFVQNLAVFARIVLLNWPKVSSYVNGFTFSRTVQHCGIYQHICFFFFCQISCEFVSS